MAKKRLLILCTGNSCRSQMAEGFARHFWADRYEVYSAGTKKHGMNPFAVQVMEEAGVPLTGHFSKTTDELPTQAMDFVVTVCSDAHENCPFFPGGKIVHHGFDDPPRLTSEMTDEQERLAVYRRVRDEIREYMSNLPTHLGDPEA
jgi:arsenate reductase (thioredoxin)